MLRFYYSARENEQVRWTFTRRRADTSSKRVDCTYIPTYTPCQRTAVELFVILYL